MTTGKAVVLLLLLAVVIVGISMGSSMSMDRQVAIERERTVQKELDVEQSRVRAATNEHALNTLAPVISVACLLTIGMFGFFGWSSRQSKIERNHMIEVSRLESERQTRMLQLLDHRQQTYMTQLALMNGMIARTGPRQTPAYLEWQQAQEQDVYVVGGN